MSLRLLSSRVRRVVRRLSLSKLKAVGIALVVVVSSMIAPVLMESLAVSPASAAPQSQASCVGPGDFGTVYLGSTWPGGFAGVPVYSNGISGSFTDCLHSTTTPQGRSVVDGYEWQCVELVVRLYLTKGWINAPWLGNGDQMYSTAPSFLKRQPQGSITSVAPGDVISFNYAGGGAGHAAVISRVQGNYLTIVNQNTDRSAVISNAYLVHGAIQMVGWAGWEPIGVVDAPNTAPPPLSVATSSVPGGRVNDPYSATLTSHGGIGHDLWGLAGGRLPSGLTLWNWGVISGTALSTGWYSFEVRVWDSKGASATRRLSFGVQGNSDMLANPNFFRGSSSWHAGHQAELHVLRHVAGVPGSASGDELELYSPLSHASVYQNVHTSMSTGTSFTFGTWVRSLARAPARVCAVLSAAPHAQSASTCADISSTWTHIEVPYDATVGGERVLGADLVVEQKGGHVAFARTELSGNGLLYASFQSRLMNRWTTLKAGSADKLKAIAYRSAALPEGSDFLKFSSLLPGGSVLQNVSASVPVGQTIRFGAWLKQADSGDLQPSEASVCLVVRAIGNGQTSETCTQVGDSWTQVSVPFEVKRRGMKGLRAEIVLRSAFSAVAVDGTMLVNAA